MNNSQKLKAVKLLVICLGVGIFHAYTFAQAVNSTFERVTIKDGLSNSTITHIIQDNNGFLWFSTYGGLNKYDGYKFTVYMHDDDDSTSIPFDKVNFLMCDDEGYIWILNDEKKGVGRFDPITEKFTNYTNNPSDSLSISSNDVTHIMQDSQGNIWLCTSNGLNQAIKKKVGGKKTVQFKHFNFGEGNTFRFLYETKNSHLLLLSNSLFLLDNKTNTIQNTGVGLSSSNIISVDEDKSGNIYIGTSGGIIKLEYNASNSAYQRVDIGELNVTPSNRNAILIDSKDNLWIATESRGIYKYNEQTNQQINFVSDEMDDKSLSDNTVYYLFEDHSGVLWCGTFSQGLCKYDLYRKGFQHFRVIPGKTNSLGGNVISGISSVSENELWVGFDLDRGVDRIIFHENDEPEFYHFINDPNNPNSIAGNSVLSLVQRKNGEVWLGSTGGSLTKIIPGDPQLNEKTVIENLTPGFWTFTLFEDSEGVLWGGTWQGGFWRYNDETGEFIIHRYNPNNGNSIGVEIIWAIGEDQYNNIWIGGNQKALSILPYGEKYKSDPVFVNFPYKKKDSLSLSNYTVNAFCLDHTGTMWAATAGGLNKVIDKDNVLQDLKPGSNLTFESYHKKDGLPNEKIAGVVEDKLGNIWVSTSNGISRFNVKDTVFTNYFESDGLQSNEFWHNAYFINNEGRIFFGGQNGFNAFYPEDIKDNPVPPSMVFTGLKLFNEPVKVNQVVNKDVILTQPINKTKSIDLSYKNNVITFEFAALHYTYPLKNQHEYMLEGFDENWNNIGNQRSATYTNLNRGKYVFKVRGYNNDGLMSEEIASIDLRIRPPWWKSIWFYALILVMLVFIIRFFIRWREKQLQYDKKILEDRLEKGQKEIETSKKEVAKQAEELKKRDGAAREQNWYNKGMIVLGDTIIKHKKSANELSKHFLSGLTKYLDVDQGALYLLNDDNKENVFLELAAGFGIPKSKLKNKKILIGESLVGACYKDNEKKIIEDIPEGYTIISSGLGSVVPKFISLIPLKYDDLTIGVVEIASVERLEDFKLEFVEKIGETFTSNMFAIKATQRMEELLEHSQQQSEEMKAQEEEMRQNMEEMMATQEEKERVFEAGKKREEELLAKISELKDIETKYKELQKNHKASGNKKGES